MRESPARAAHHALALGRALRTQQRVRIELVGGAAHEGEVLRFAEQAGRVEAVELRTTTTPATTLTVALAQIDRVLDADETTTRTTARVIEAAQDRPTTPPPSNPDATVRVRPLRLS